MITAHITVLIRAKFETNPLKIAIDSGKYECTGYTDGDRARYYIGHAPIYCTKHDNVYDYNAKILYSIRPRIVCSVSFTVLVRGCFFFTERKELVIVLLRYSPLLCVRYYDIVLLL